jgi:DNA ligase-1
MLAHDYHKRGKDIQYPCFVQRKLDGTRCVAVPGKGLFSRNKKRYPHLEHILEEIQRLPESIQLDGELYSATLTFQEIVGLVKRETLQPGDAEKQRQIQFHVYDIVSDKSYRERYMNLQYLFRRHRFQHLVLVPTEGCASEEEMKEKHAVYVADGYEGVMLRNKEGLYRGTRCVDLQKYKEFLDGEYEVVGWEEGQGLEEGCVLWICQTAQGKRFSCRPRGTREDRQALFRDGGTYVGRWLTVRYQEETDDGLPRFPVGIAFREYE